MSFSYTAKARKEHDLRVESDLEQIATRLLADFPGQIEALVLVGSFGRGEGTVVIRDGEVWPVHDYDIVIVGKDDLPREKVGWARLELAKTLGIPQVDLFPYRRGQLSAFGPSLLALDLKTASHVFHGDASVLDAIRPIDPTKIPIEEGRRLLFNRVVCLLESIREDNFHQPVEGEEAFRIAYHASKVILTAVEALLIESGEYHPRYREREARFLARFPRYRRIAGLVKTATAIKLLGMDASFDVIRYWLWARRMYLTVLFRIVCRSYETPLADWWDLATFYDRWFFFFMRKTWYRLFNDLKYQEWVAIQRRVRLELAEIFLQLSRESRETVRQTYMDAAREYLVAVTGKPTPADWEEARRQAVEWDYRILHPH